MAVFGTQGLQGLQGDDTDPSLSTGGISGSFDLTKSTPSAEQSQGGTLGVQAPDLRASAGLASAEQATATLPEIAAGNYASIQQDTKSDPDMLNEIGATAKDVGKGVIDNVLSSLQQGAVEDYQQELAQYANKTKNWFDSSYDVVPTLEEYLVGLPDPTEQLSSGTITGGDMNESDAGNAFLKFGTFGISNAFKDQDQAEYIWNKGGEGAAKGGLSGGGWGALVGGAVGIVEGALTWASAEKGKVKMLKETMAKYKEKYDKWKADRNFAKAKNIQAATEASLAKKDIDEQQLEAKQQAALNTKRQGMMNVVQNFGKQVLR